MAKAKGEAQTYIACINNTLEYLQYSNYLHEYLE